MRSARIGVSLLCLTLAAASARAGEVPYLLADIGRGELQTSLGGEPSGFFELGGRLSFSTADSESLDQAILWSTDGTARGTVQISTTLCVAHCADITPLATWHGITLLRIATNPDCPFRTVRLGRTDGTAAGTFLLTGDLFNEYDYVPLTIQIPPGGGFLFSACSWSYEACQLWRSDGTRAGTAAFQGTDSLPFLDPRSFTVWRDRLYFVASRVPGGDPGLWSTDGTPEGTRFIHEARDLGGTRPGPLVATRSHLFFTSGEIGEDLWVTDGSPDGTRLLADFAPPPCDGGCPSPDVDSITVAGDVVYFEVQRPGSPFEIWRSDGTGEGTGPVLALPRRIVWARSLQRIGGHWLFQGANANGTISLWTIDDGFTRAAPLTDCAGGPCPEVFDLPIESPAPGIWLFVGYDDQGWGLWSTDGTGPGTRRLAGVCSDFSASPGGPDVFPGPRGLIYFRACPAFGLSPDDTELWVTDGTAKGTRRAGGQVSGVGFLDGLAYFGSSPVGQPAAELWATDGTPGHERKVTTLRRYRSGSDPWFQPFRDGALFAAFRAGHAQMWTSDGTPGGTFPLQEPSSDVQRFFHDFLGLGSPVQLFTVYRQKGDDDPKAGTEIWRTDGTLRGTRSLAVLPSLIGSWLSWDGGILFTSANPPDCSLWYSDGTGAGTREILHRPPALVCPFGLIALGPRFLFYVVEPDADRRPAGKIFLSDGTPAGTRRIASFPGRYFGAQPVEIGGTVFFQVLSDSSAELWQTDGTPAGTRVALSLSGVSGLYVFRGSLYLTAALSEEPDGGRGLFRVPPGGKPVLLAQILRYSAYTLYDPLSFAPASDRLLFLFEDKQSGAELWVTDGTPAGTRRIRRFQPFPADPIPEPDPLVSAGDRVFFAAGDGIHGRELWESDGAPEGTRMVVDLAPGGYSSMPAPSSLTVSKNYLFFAADDGNTGLEPWALPLAP